MHLLAPHDPGGADRCDSCGADFMTTLLRQQLSTTLKRALVIILEDGTVFEGLGFGFPCETSGEVVFNTGMVGYTESLQILLIAGKFSFKLIS